MADRLQIYGGLKADMPELLPREIGYCTDTHELYVGSVAEGNRLVGCVAWGNDINTLQKSLKSLTDVVDGKLTASKAESVADVASDATTEAIATAFNGLLASLKTAGIMKT